MCGGLCAVGAYAVDTHSGGNGVGASGEVGAEDLPECGGQRVRRRYALRARDPDPEVLDTSAPVVLVVDLRKYDLGNSGSRDGGGTRAAVVYDGGDPAE